MQLKTQLTTHLLTLFLGLCLSLPNPAWALRIQNGGLEEQTPKIHELASALRDNSSTTAPNITGGLEERSSAQLWSEQESQAIRDELVRFFTSNKKGPDDLGRVFRDHMVKLRIKNPALSISEGDKQKPAPEKYGYEQWGEYEDLGVVPLDYFVRIGPLFFMDFDRAGSLPVDLRNRLGRNLILTRKLSTSAVSSTNSGANEEDRFPPHVVSGIAAMLHSDWKGKHVIDIGTNDSILLLVAGAMGASFLEGFDIRREGLREARDNLLLNGYRDQFHLFEGDLRNPEQIAKRLSGKARSTKIAVISHIGGKWPRYEVTNRESIDLIPVIERRMGSSVEIFIGVGYVQFSGWQKFLFRSTGLLGLANEIVLYGNRVRERTQNHQKNMRILKHAEDLQNHQEQIAQYGFQSQYRGIYTTGKKGTALSWAAARSTAIEIVAGLEEFSSEAVLKIAADLSAGHGEQTAVENFSHWILEPILQASSGQRTRLESAREKIQPPYSENPYGAGITPQKRNQIVGDNTREQVSLLTSISMIEFLEAFNEETKIKLESIDAVTDAYERAVLIFSALLDQKISLAQFPHLHQFLKTWSESSKTYDAEYTEMLESSLRLPDNGRIRLWMITHPEETADAAREQLFKDLHSPEYASERYARLDGLYKTAKAFSEAISDDAIYVKNTTIEEYFNHSQKLLQQLFNSESTAPGTPGTDIIGPSGGLEEKGTAINQTRVRAELLQTLGQMGETPHLLAKPNEITNVATELQLSERLQQAGYSEGAMLIIPEGPVPADAFQDSRQINVYVEPKWKAIVKQNFQLDFRFQIVDKPDQAQVIIGSERLKNELASGLFKNKQTFLVVDQGSVSAVTSNRLAWLLTGGELTAGRVLYLHTNFENRTAVFA